MRRICNAVAASVLVLLSPQLARACSCPGEKPATDALRDATAVFRGVVIAVEPAEARWRTRLRSSWCTIRNWLCGPDTETCLANAYIANQWENYGFVATFRVEAVWKGVEQHEVRVRSNVPGGGSCGLGWAVGDEWIIYAYGTTLLATDGCTRSKFGARVAAESEALGDPVGSLR